MGSTQLNLLLDVGFNREVGADTVLYWNKNSGSLSVLIDEIDDLSDQMRFEYGQRAKERIKSAYSWEFIASEYKRVWNYGAL